MDTPKEMFCTAITQQPNLSLFSEDGIETLKAGLGRL